MGIISNIKNYRNQQKAKQNGQKNEAEMTFLEHLEELRWHLVRSVLAIVIIAIAFFVYREWIMENIIMAPFDGSFPMNRFLCWFQQDFLNNPEHECLERIEVNLQVLSPYEVFLKALTLSAIGGIILAFPYIIWEFWRFIKPGLHSHEVKAVRGNVFVMSMLFFLGVAFSYYIIIPFSARFLAGFQLYEGLEANWQLGKTISFITQLVLAGGLLFEMPILIYYLTKMGIITPQFLKTYHRHAIVLMLVLAAILTPPDPTSQLLIFAPLYFLFRISIRVSARVYKKQQEEADIESTDIMKT